ncbi:MAG TPA: hypothetical protein ENI23_16660 [bacterium]|nr:hypothetical protein [bacterium]
MKTIRETEHTKVIILDEPGENKACGEYRVQYRNNLGCLILDAIKFQEGPIKENGINGCQVEDLLAICIHRLEGFQSGELACEESKYALMNVHQSITFLNSRTLDRKKRGVEGTNQK